MARTPAPGARERILSVASRLFYEHGVRAVGMNQIITEAGIGKNLLYQHFPAKTDLVTAYLAQAGECRLDAVRRARDVAGDDPREQLLAMIGEIATTVGQPGFRGCALRNYLAEFPDDGPGPETPAGVAHGLLAAARRGLRELAAECSASDPELLAAQLQLLVDGLYMQAAYRRRAKEASTTATDVAVELARRIVEVA